MSPSATANVSMSVSSSLVVVIVPVPAVDPAGIAMLASGPKSSTSAVPLASVSGMVTVLASAFDSVAVTVTGEPSATGLGEAERLTAATGAQVSAALINSILTFRPGVHARLV